MSNHHSHPRKGLRTAAAGLTLAMTVALAPGAVGTFTNFEPFQQAAFAADSDVPNESQIIDADMIASGRVTKSANLTDSGGVGRGLISGHVYKIAPGGNPGATIDNGNIKLNGVTVYAQFRDKDGSYSPIFRAKTHDLPGNTGGNGGPGTYAFGTDDKGISWTDADGTEHTYSARTDQFHRIWVEPFEDEVTGNMLQPIRQANGFVPGSFNPPSRYPLGSFVSADLNMQLTAVFLQEMAPSSRENSHMMAPADRVVHDTEGPIRNAAGQLSTSNVLSGRVWLEAGHSDGGIVATGPSYNAAPPYLDVPAEGYTVYASTLTKEGAAANDALKAEYGKDLQGLVAATKAMLEDHPEYINKTVYGETDNEGHYALRFGDYTDESQTREDFLNPNHVFVWVEDKDGVVQQGYTGFSAPIFQRFNAGGGFRPAAVPAENQTVTSRVQDLNTPRYGKNVNSLYNVNYAIMPYAPAYITTDYNTTDNPAVRGTTVTPEFHGELSKLDSQIEWRDGDGKVVKTCELDQTQGIKAQVAACTFDIPDDANDGDVYTAVLVSGGNDVSASSVVVKVQDKDIYEPEYEDATGKPGSKVEIDAPSFTDEEGEDVDAPEGTKFAPGEGAPDGVEIDEDTGAITYPVPEDAEPGKTITVPVEVTYPDGSKDTVEVDITVVPSDADKYEPEYEDGSGKPGSKVEIDAPSFTDEEGEDVDAPEGTKFAPGEGAPDGVEIDEDTGAITYPVPEDAEPGKTITVPVEVTYPDGSKDTVEVEITVVATDADTYQPVYEDTTVEQGETATVPTPEDEDGQDIPEGTKYAATEDTPKWATVNEDGSLTLEPGTDVPAGDYGIPVEVVYPDGSKETVEAKVTVSEAAPVVTDAEKYQPEYDEGYGAPGTTAPVDAPTFVDEETGEAVTVPGGTKFESSDSNVTVNEDGSLEVPIPAGKKAGETVEVPVTVTYPDGTKDEVTVTVNVTDPAADPSWKDNSGKPGETVTVPNEGGEVPEGSTVEPTGPGKAELDENGNIKVEIDDDAKPGDKINVVVKDEDGEEIGNVTVTVEEPAKETTQADEFEPAYEDGSGEPGETVEIDAPTFTDEEGKDTQAPEGTTFAPGEGAPEGAKIDENTGAITYPVSEDAKPGDKITIPVVVTYPDGSTDTVDVTITVDEPKDEAPKWTDGKGEPGESVTIPNEGGPVEEGTKPGKTEGPGKAEIDEDGNVVVEIDDDAKPGDKVVVEIVDKDGEVIDTVVVEVTEPSDKDEAPKWTDGKGEPGESVTIPNEGGPVEEGTKPGKTEGPGKAEIDEDGNVVVEIDEDAKPGDKVVVEIVDKDGEVIDTVVVEVTEPSDKDEAPNYGDGEGAPGESVTIPNKGGPVEEGTKPGKTEGPGKAEIDEDGNVVVEIDEDAKPGDKVVVEIVDKDGEVIDTVVVEVTEPSDKDEAPNYGDGEGAPGESVTIPNKGGEVPDGSTVEVEGPGTAGFDEDGNIVVDIDEDAKPGDKITVTVKDKDGNIIDQFVVVVTEPGSSAATDQSDDQGGSLARTGAEITAALVIGAGLLAAGAVMLSRVRRRRNS